jgi:hypothetical protein
MGPDLQPPRRRVSLTTLPQPSTSEMSTSPKHQAPQPKRLLIHGSQARSSCDESLRVHAGLAPSLLSKTRWRAEKLRQGVRNPSAASEARCKLEPVRLNKGISIPKPPYPGSRNMLSGLRSASLGGSILHKCPTLAGCPSEAQTHVPRQGRPAVTLLSTLTLGSPSFLLLWLRAFP